MDYWLHQKSEPLFPEVIWSKPETKHGAGKLAIIGGSAGAMSNIAAAYGAAEQSGVGTIHLLVPDSLSKVTKGIQNIGYAPSNPSGGFAKTALGEILSLSRVVDGVFLPGDMGKNSETSLMVENYIGKYDGTLALSSYSFETFTGSITSLLLRPNTIIFLHLNQLRDLVMELKFENAVTSDIGLSQLAEILHKISYEKPSILVIKNERRVWFSNKGRVVDSDHNNFNEAKAVVWALQQPEKSFEALVSSVFLTV